MFNALTHRKAKSAQVGLSYFFLSGFFVLLILTALGKVRVDVEHFMESGVTMILSFWFMRQRSSTDEPPQYHPSEKPSDPKVSQSPTAPQ